MGKVDVGIVEGCEMSGEGKVYVRGGGGIGGSIGGVGDKVMMELKGGESKKGMGVEDVYEGVEGG